MHRHSTEIRRSLQPLWNAYDRILLPRLTEGLCVAVSGGPDSRALLESLARWSKRSRGNILVTSIDHCTRPEAAAETKSVLARAQILGFPVESSRLFPPLKLDEQTLRRRRYEALFNVMEQNCLASLVTAHHEDDDAEGFLLNLLGLGGGQNGAAMAVESDCLGKKILRPLLGFDKNMLMEVLKYLGVNDFFVDPTDKALGSNRSIIRHSVLPTLQKYHPSLKSRFALFAREKADTNQVVNAMAQKYVEIDEHRGVASINIKDCPDELICQQAVKIALKALLPAKDVRVNGALVARLIRAALDPNGQSIMVNNLSFISFDLPGAKVQVSCNGIMLQRRVG